MPARPATRGDATRNELKRAARRLFAERGIAAVGMRDILDAAGQRNAAAVHYYFGGKDDLLRELVADGARAIDRARRAMLDAAEAAGSPTLDAVVRAMVLPHIDVEGETGERETYLRFIGNLQAERRELFQQAAREESAAYARCLDHIRRLLGHMPLATVNQRLLFAGLSTQAILAAREAALDGADESHPYWTRPGALDAIVLAIQSILVGPHPLS